MIHWLAIILIALFAALTAYALNDTRNDLDAVRAEVRYLMERDRLAKAASKAVPSPVPAVMTVPDGRAKKR